MLRATFRTKKSDHNSLFGFWDLLVATAFEVAVLWGLAIFVLRSIGHRLSLVAKMQFRRLALSLLPQFGLAGFEQDAVMNLAQRQSVCPATIF